MPLLTPAETTSARIAADAEQLAAHLSAAIHAANRMADETLKLPDAELNEWLNAKPLKQRMDEFTDHYGTGIALNTAAEWTEKATGKADGATGRVDLRSVRDKLISQGRELSVIDDVFTVTTIPKPPEESL